MPNNRPHFSRFTRGRTWASLFAFAFLPLIAVLTNAAPNSISMSSLQKPVLWLLFIVMTFFYAQQRCSSKDRFYIDGLYYVSCFIGAGTMGVSFLLVLPFLSLTLLASAAIAIYNDLRGRKDLSPEHFYKLVSLFYKDRLIR